MRVALIYKAMVSCYRYGVHKEIDSADCQPCEYYDGPGQGGVRCNQGDMDYGLGVEVNIISGVFKGHHGRYVEGDMSKHPLRYGIECDTTKSIMWCKKEHLLGRRRRRRDRIKAIPG